jgi:FKBP-type peptidyl-prolyl cis-trans isomerase FklB
MKKFIILCAALCCLSASAATKKKAKKVEAPATEKVDTIGIDLFSYAFGKATTNGLMQYLVQRMGVDTTYMEDFLQGFDTKELTESDKRQKARLSGVEIRQQVENQMLPQIAQQVNDSTRSLNTAMFLNGFRDGIANKNEMLPISEDSLQQLVQKQMQYYHQEKMERQYGANRRAGEEFLAKNKKADGVITTASGLQYKVLTKGEGDIPTASQRVKVNYEGHLLDGTVFDSSYKRNQPATFGCNQVIKGWTEALTMMPVGSKWELYIPQELAYGDRESGQIPPFSMLIFTVELLSIEK